MEYNTMLEEISYAMDRNLKSEEITPLVDRSYKERSENILISRATGSRKSFLACAFGHQAYAMGYQALYLNQTRFTEILTMPCT